jgi:hypothetical protein
MPSRKQRRRRQKERRHDYEYVLVDEEGHEVPVEPSELRKERPPETNGRKQETKKQPKARSGRPLRVVKPPSWNRVLKKGAIFFPVFFLLFSVVNKNTPLASHVALSLLYTLLFIPFMYLMDRTAYRTYLRRTGDAPGRRR